MFLKRFNSNSKCDYQLKLFSFSSNLAPNFSPGCFLSFHIQKAATHLPSGVTELLPELLLLSRFHLLTDGSGSSRQELKSRCSASVKNRFGDFNPALLIRVQIFLQSGFKCQPPASSSCPNLSTFGSKRGEGGDGCIKTADAQAPLLINCLCRQRVPHLSSECRGASIKTWVSVSSGTPDDCCSTTCDK